MGVTLFQVLCFLGMVLGQAMGNNSIVASMFGLDLVCVVICPLVLAAVGGMSGIASDVSVLKNYPAAAACIGAVGLARGALFFKASSVAGFVGAMKYLLVSFVLMTIWFLIFELTRFLVNKPTKYNKPKKRS